MSSAEFPIELVEKEVRGKASEEEIRVLNSNKDLWLQHLKNIKRKVEQTTTEKKADLLSRGPRNPYALKEFHQWRAGANRFKMEVEKRIAQIKPESGGVSLAPILQELLVEVKYIAGLLSDKFDSDEEIEKKR